jgi:hypothetical protein
MITQRERERGRADNPLLTLPPEEKEKLITLLKKELELERSKRREYEAYLRSIGKMKY